MQNMKDVAKNVASNPNLWETFFGKRHRVDTK